MTDSDNSVPQDDSDEDIYKDIPEFNFEDELVKLEGSKEIYKKEVDDLSEKVKALTEENEEVKKLNEVLKKNLSTLLKTAQAEVQRKDSMIQELRNKVESLTFRRNRNTYKDNYTSTDDLEVAVETRHEPERYKSITDKKRSKSDENRTSSDNERKSLKNEGKKKESSAGKGDSSNCDNDRFSGRQSKTNFRHSDNNQGRRSDRKSTKYENNSEGGRCFRKDQREHLKCDSCDKKRHSKASDCRFLSRRRNSRERRSDRRRGDSSGKRSDESSERSKKRKGRSRSREIFRRSKESSVEKPKMRSSLDKESVVRVKDQIGTKSEVLGTIKSFGVFDKKRTISENFDKRTVQEDVTIKSNQNKDKRAFKHEKQSSSDIFNTKSPLDALYNDMITSWNSNRFVSSKSGKSQPESDLEDGEIPISQTKKQHLDSCDSQSEEDWTLSFKNERKKEEKPLTLYSRRMMQKFSTETKESKASESQENKVETEKVVALKNAIKNTKETEKEPGELTDDENIVESSKEFQELTKVASVEIGTVEVAPKEKTFTEPTQKHFSKKEILKTEETDKEEQKEVEKPPCEKDDDFSKEAEANKETREVIEYSPFKNNYKLIEISMIKPPSGEHVLDYYHRREISSQTAEEKTLDSSDAKDKSESDKSISKQSDTSEEKTSELKIFIPPISESPKEKEKKLESGEEKQSRKKKEKTGENITDCIKGDDSVRGKLRSASKKEVEKSVNDAKSRKRKPSETQEGNSESKKRKLDKSETPRKSLRNERNLKSETDQPKPEADSEKTDKEDIMSFEFFKPVAKEEVPETPGKVERSVCTTTDYKMTATMSVTGVVRLETPNKCVERLKNLMINEHMIFNVLDSKNNSQFSPLFGSKCIEMTPRRLLKNDLMLSDSEDDSFNKTNADEAVQDAENFEDDDETSESENSECSDSGASDFVDLL